MESKFGRKMEPESNHKTPSREMPLYNDVGDRKRINRSPIKSNSKDEGEELPLKKPRLLVDTSANCQPLCEALSSNESFISGADNDSTAPVPSSGLSAYLEDIISDEEPLEETTSPGAKTPPPSTLMDTPTLRSKEELLQLMERVDRDITSIEQQISVLEKRQENTQNQLTTPSSSVSPPTLSSVNVTSSFISSSDHTSSSAHLSSHHRHHHTSQPERSVLETIYHENRMKARSNQMALFGNDKLGYMTPTYFQPCELPQIARNRQRHKLFFPKLATYLKRRKLTKHLKEVSLCEEYERYSTDWEKRLERWTQSAKKKHRDARNKELFEKMFPELRSKRDQLRDEAYSRVGVRSFGVVRSEAELNQLAYELFEQDEARGRCRLTHSVLPSMLISERERSVQFFNSNGLITDPMSVHREAKNVNNWSEEEKKLFKEKFILFPKNFEKIASFLPHKSMNECVRYYYLVKKKEHFKQLIRRSSFKRRRLSKHQSEYPLNSSTILGGHSRPHPKPHLTSSEGHSSAPPSVLTSPTITPSQSLTTIKSPTGLPEYDGWTEKEIASLKEGLCKYGRAWGKVYREVGGRKSATQCKQFYDTFCTDRHLQLNSALAEHSSKKNAEKVKKKMEEMKKQAPLAQAPPPQSSVIKRPERKSLQLATPTPSHRVEEEEENGEDEEDESEDSDGSESDDGRSDDESDSETTLTDSGSEDRPTPSTTTTTSRGIHHHKPLRLSIDSTHHSVDSLQSPLDIFLSAAEALSNTVPVEIALHDHTYPRPPMEIQGSSGLQLIAAAAAVISPGLSKTSSSNKVPFSTKAPRGRPPSQQKRGSNYSQKLAPTYLTPTSGTSHNILLQDFKPSLRNRSRSAPTEKGRPAIPPPPHPYGNKPLPYPAQSVKGTTRTSTNATYRTTTNTVSSKDINLIASLKPTSISNGHGVSNLLEATTMGGNGSSHDRSVQSPVFSYPLINSTSSTTTSGTKTQRKDSSGGTVFELNLGNMALLLAATGTNQQAALLLPQSTLLNKQALAMLQSGSVCITDSGATATINIDPSVLASSVSNGGRATVVKTDMIPPVNNKSPSIVKPSPLSIAVTTKDTVPPNKGHSTGVSPPPPPPSNDLTNLNLLSNLVAGLPKKSDPLSVTQSIPNTVTNKQLLTRKNDEKIENIKPAVINRSVATTTAATSSSYPTTTSSQQQSLMLYARSLTMPLNSTSAQSPDEVDSLEYATRGISELTKLLGGGGITDNGPSTPSPSSANTKWSPDDLLCNPYNERAPPTSVHTITSSLTASSSVMTDYLAPPTHQLSLSTRTPTPINALSEDTI